MAKPDFSPTELYLLDQYKSNLESSSRFSDWVPSYLVIGVILGAYGYVRDIWVLPGTAIGYIVFMRLREIRSDREWVEPWLSILRKYEAATSCCCCGEDVRVACDDAGGESSESLRADE